MTGEHIKERGETETGPERQRDREAHGPLQKPTAFLVWWLVILKF